MRSMLRATVIALVLSSVASVAHGQALKIAFVNSQALMPAAPGYAAAESTLSKEGEGFRTQLQKMQDSVNKMLSDYQKAEPTLFKASRPICRPNSSSSSSNFRRVKTK
jgi:Skp family chaperone for outer membrane proteins